MNAPRTTPPPRTPIRLRPGRLRRTAARTARLTAAFIRATAAAAVIGALLGGVPYLLHRAAPNPWPDHRRSPAEVWEALSAPTTDQVLLDTLAAVAWVAWAGFALSLLAELAWYARHAPALARDLAAHRAHQHDISALRAPAAWLAGLLIIALVAATRATHTTPTPTAHAAHTSAPPAATAPLRADTAGTSPASKPPTAHALSSVPAYADPTTAAYTAYTVRPGDTLWDIAATRLGDPVRWPRIYALSRDLAQPDGGRLTDPDAIRPGWTLHLPADAAPEPAPPLTPSPVQPDPAPGNAQPPQPSPPASPPHSIPVIPAPSLPTTPPPTAPDPSKPTPTPNPRADSARADDSAGLDVPAAGFLGATLAAGIAAALLWARRHRRRTRPGTAEVPPLPPITAAAHRAHHRSSPPADRDPAGLVADVPLRRRPTLTAALPPGRIAVGVRANSEIPLDAVATGHGLGLVGPGALAVARALAAAVLHDTERSRPAEPRVRLLLSDADARLLLGPDTDPQTLAGLPQVLQLPNTEACLAAAQRHILAATRATQHAPETAHLPAGQECLVWLTSGGPEYRARIAGLASAGGEPPHGASAPPLLVVVLGAWPVHARTGADGTVLGPTDPATDALENARLLHLSHGAFTDLVDGLHEAHGRSRPFAAAVRRTPPTLDDDGGDPPDDNPPAPPPDGPVPDPGPPPAPVSAVPRWTAPQPNRSHSPLPPATSDSPPDEGPSPKSAGAPAPPVTLRVLGPFRVDIRGQETTVGTHLRPNTREFLALLATRPTGIRTEEIADHLNLDDSDPSESARQLANLRRAVRRLLRDATGHTSAQFVTTAGERHRLDTTLVATDLAAFTRALDDAAHATDDTTSADALDAALAAYTGDLLDNADYRWADIPREDLRRRAVDAAVRLAELHDGADRTDRALALLEWAIDRDPYNEALYQRTMRLQATAGRDDAVRRTWDRLRARLGELDAAPSPDTTALLTHSAHRSGADATH